jgi:hypothetical protein
MHLSRSSWAARTILFALVATAAQAVGGLTVARADAPPAGDVTLLPQSFPNYFLQHHPSAAHNGQGKALSSIADPANHLLFEMTGQPCNPRQPIAGENQPNVIAYDTDTYAEKGAVCVASAPTDPRFHYGWLRNQPYAYTDSPLAAVSSKSRRLFLADTYHSFGDTVGAGVSQVIVIDESPFRISAVWPLPADALPQIMGISAYGPTDDLLIFTNYGITSVGTTPGPPGAALTQISAANGAPRGPSWAPSPSDCPHALTPQYASATAYRGRDSVFIPCDRNPSTTGQSTATPAILTAHLDRPNCPGLCISQSPVVTPPPYPGFDFLMDSGSDRGFMPQLLVSTGQTSLEAFDGRVSQFLSLTNANGNAFGFDAASGRVYALGPTGITVIDGRRTPLAQGQLLPKAGGRLNNQLVSVLPADATHAYRRIVAPYTACDCAPARISVFADTMPVSSDPPATAIDANTLAGPVPAGAEVNKAFSATARGYGFHVDFVGSADQVLYNSAGPTFGGMIPFGQNNRDLMGAAVTKLNQSDGGALGQASALADGSGDTQLTYLRCTDLRSVRRCSQASSICSQLRQPPETCMLPDQPPNRPNTEQAWPFPDAVCSEPALHSTGQPQTAGIFVTTSYDDKGQPVQTIVPGSDKNAAAAVSCAVKGAGGSAMVGDQGFSEGPVSISVTSAHTQTSVTMPKATADVAVGDSRSEATGIKIDVPGVGSLDIGRVAAHGVSRAGARPGTASTTLDRQISDVTITPAGGKRQTLCGDAAQCASGLSQVLAGVNAGFAGHLAVFLPTPDDRFGGPGSKTGNGSPGGYTAVVQANLPEQNGDHQFNGMAPEEATFLPTLRIVWFDDNKQVSRIVTDLAGVQADSEYGIQALGGTEFKDTFTPDQASCAAGVTPASAGSSSSFLQACSSELLLTGGFSTSGTGHAGYSAPSEPAGGLQQLIVQVFKGFDWLRRNPAAAVQMFAFLLLLGLPMVLMARRRMLEQDQ